MNIPKFGEDHKIALWIFLGLPILASALAILINKYSFEIIPALLILIMLVGASRIVNSKKGEALTNKWFHLGPPLNKEKNMDYFSGYALYLIGFVGILTWISES